MPEVGVTLPHAFAFREEDAVNAAQSPLKRLEIPLAAHVINHIIAQDLAVHVGIARNQAQHLVTAGQLSALRHVGRGLAVTIDQRIDAVADRMHLLALLTEPRHDDAGIGHQGDGEERISEKGQNDVCHRLMTGPSGDHDRQQADLLDHHGTDDFAEVKGRSIFPELPG